MQMRNIAIIFVVAIIGGIIALSGRSLIEKEVVQPPLVYNIPDSRLAPVSLRGEIPTFTRAAQIALPAVVHIKTKLNMEKSDQNPLFELFFGNPKRYPEGIPTGSGVIISQDGFIITNNHVIHNAERITVVLNDKRSYSAKLIGTDPATDIALIKINEINLPWLTFGDSELLLVGDWVLAVGNPFNLTSTVTAGIVSAKARNLEISKSESAIESFIQTDAVVNPGNSGGALVNLNGELIGINTAIASVTGYYSGYSFAVPSSITKKVVNDILAFGTVQRAVLGVNIVEIDARVAKEYNLDKIEGVLIEEVFDDGAATEAGLQVEDVILKIDDKEINSMTQLQEQNNSYSPGQKAKFTIKRNGEIQDIIVTFKNVNGTTSIISSLRIEVLGATFENVPEETKSRLNIENGVVIKKLTAGKLLNLGIREEFIITSINRRPITSLSELQSIIDKTSGGVYIEGVYPDGVTGYYAFGMQ